MTQQEAQRAFRKLSRKMDEDRRRADKLLEEGKIVESMEIMLKGNEDLRELFNLAILAEGEAVPN